MHEQSIITIIGKNNRRRQIWLTKKSAQLRNVMLAAGHCMDLMDDEH